MLTLTMTNDNDIPSKFKTTIHILFVFGLIIVLIICFRPNSQDPLFRTALTETNIAISVQLLTRLELTESRITLNSCAHAQITEITSTRNVHRTKSSSAEVRPQML